jgi:hypothetical protein
MEEQTFRFDLIYSLLGSRWRALVAVRVIIAIEVIVQFRVSEGPGLHVLESFTESLRSV